MIIKHDVLKCGGMITECTDLGEIQTDISSCCFDVGKHGLSVKLPKYYIKESADLTYAQYCFFNVQLKRYTAKKSVRYKT